MVCFIIIKRIPPQFLPSLRQKENCFSLLTLAISSQIIAKYQAFLTLAISFRRFIRSSISFCEL